MTNPQLGKSTQLGCPQLVVRCGLELQSGVQKFKLHITNDPIITIMPFSNRKSH